MNDKNKLVWKRDVAIYGGWQWKRINFHPISGRRLTKSEMGFGDDIVIRIRRDAKRPWHDIIRSDECQIDMRRDDICAELIDAVIESIGEAQK